jgi:nickel/cobalt transporter (NicO) family protein
VDFLTSQFNSAPAWSLVATVLIVGVLHTIVPDHWVPITLIARQRGWSKKETARAALQAGTGHVVTTLILALIVWAAGVAVAAQFGHLVDSISSIALVGFGLWIAGSSWREIHSGERHGHSHDFSHLHCKQRDPEHNPVVHGPELQQIPVEDGELLLSIYELDQLPRFRITSNGIAAFDGVKVETHRPDGQRQTFIFADRGNYWESTTDIPEPHGFKAVVNVERAGLSNSFAVEFEEHEHGEAVYGGHTHERGGHSHDSEGPELDKLYAPVKLRSQVAATHIHTHKHSDTSPSHRHWHDHSAASSHDVSAVLEGAPPLHQHSHKTTARVALLLILGSSPMVEGIPAFFAAGKFGVGLIVLMAVVFGLSTIATYVLLCVYSTAGLQRVKLGAIEKYGEVLSGAFIGLVGVAFWLFPML